MQSFIVCPGANAAGLYQQVWELAQPGDQIICANKGILALPMPAGTFTRYSYNLVWLVADQLCTEADWWSAAALKALNHGYCPLFSEQVWERLPRGAGPMFTQGDSLSPTDSELHPQALRSNATVAGAAVQLAVHTRAASIHLLGVDMEGAGYFDGSRYSLERQTWPHLRTLQALIDAVRASGVSVTLLSPSRLI